MGDRKKRKYIECGIGEAVGLDKGEFDTSEGMDERCISTNGSLRYKCRNVFVGPLKSECGISLRRRRALNGGESDTLVI